MAAMGPNQANWSATQRELRRRLEGGEGHEKGISLFFSQHAKMHAAAMAGTESWSYEDELLDDVTDEQFRGIPPKGQHSVAWLIWHMARIEDVTMNLLVAAGPQVLHEDDWLKQINSPIEHTGNEMSVAAIAELSAALDLKALRAYRQTVGQRTRQVVADLRAGEMARLTPAERLERVCAEKAVLPAARYIVDYWSRRTVAGLLLMPPTRHLFLHLNEAAEIKQRLG